MTNTTRNHILRFFLCLFFVFLGLARPANQLVWASWYTGDELGYVDEVTVNNREFSSLGQDTIAFYREDLRDGQVHIAGILESESKKIKVEQLRVEISTDGGQSWHQAEGHGNWSYSFSPEIGKSYRLSLRVVKAHPRKRPIAAPTRKQLMARQQELRADMAAILRTKMLENTEIIKRVVNSEGFKSGNAAEVKAGIDLMISLLGESKSNLGRGREFLSRLPAGGGNIPVIPGSASKGSGKDDKPDIDLPDSGQDHSGMAGTFSKDMYTGSDMNYYSSTNNSDVMYGMGHAKSETLKYAWKGYLKGNGVGKESDYVTCVREGGSFTTCSPKLKDGEVLSHNSTGDDDSADSGGSDAVATGGGNTGDDAVETGSGGTGVGAIFGATDTANGAEDKGDSDEDNVDEPETGGVGGLLLAGGAGKDGQDEDKDKGGNKDNDKNSNDSGDNNDNSDNNDGNDGDDSDDGNSDDDDDDDDDEESDDDDENNDNNDGNNDDEQDSEDDKSSYGGGTLAGGGSGSPDPMDNEGGAPMSAEGQAVAGKLLGGKNPLGVNGSQGQAGGGDDDQRGDTGNDNDAEGEMRVVGTAGSPDDNPDRQDNGHGPVASGPMKSTVKEKLGGGVRVKER